MIRSFFRGLVAIATLTLLAGCSNPETPQEVAAAFWQAMAENDAGDVMEYSTLAEATAFDGYKRSWTDAVPSFGRVVIEDREATIVTRLPAEAGTEGERLELVTYLVRFQDQWLVDYDRTGEAILNPSPFSSIMGELSARFSSSSDDFEQQMEQLARDLEAYSEEIGREAEGAMEAFGKKLQEAMRELERSVEDALKDSEPTPEEDRVILEQAARDLDRQADELNEPTMESIASASRTVAETGERFTRLSEETLNRYREEWQQRLAEMRADADEFIEQLRL
mgnify:CR=1 FL=1